MREKMENAVAGDRTRVTRVTGGNTHHYTTTTCLCLIVIEGFLLLYPIWRIPIFYIIRPKNGLKKLKESVLWEIMVQGPSRGWNMWINKIKKKNQNSMLTWWSIFHLFCPLHLNFKVIHFFKLPIYSTLVISAKKKL